MTDPAAATPNEGTPPQEGETPAANYYWQDGMAGEGDAPEWLKADKYKSVADQAKAYTDLEKKFGSFKGAPETYEIPETFDSDDTFVKMLTDIGTKSNMNQEAFGELLDLGNQLISASDSVKDELELANLGDNAQERLDHVDDYLRHNLGDRYDELRSAVANSKSVELVEALIKSSVPGQPNLGNVDGNHLPTQGDVEKLMTELDAKGKTLYSYSKPRQQEVLAAIAKMQGV